MGESELHRFIDNLPAPSSMRYELQRLTARALRDVERRTNRYEQEASMDSLKKQIEEFRVKGRATVTNSDLSYESLQRSVMNQREELSRLQGIGSELHRARIEAEQYKSQLEAKVQHDDRRHGAALERQLSTISAKSHRQRQRIAELEKLHRLDRDRINEQIKVNDQLKKDVSSNQLAKEVFDAGQAMIQEQGLMIKDLKAQLDAEHKENGGKAAAQATILQQGFTIQDLKSQLEIKRLKLKDKEHEIQQQALLIEHLQDHLEFDT